MKKPTTLFASVLAFGLLSGGAAHAQQSVLMISDGRDANINFADWIESERPGQYSVDLSSNVDTSLLTTNSSNGINQTQMNLLNSYDLIVVPRLGPGNVGNNISSSDWNNVTAPILNLHAQTLDVGNWGWINTHSGNIQNLSDISVEDPASSLFDGVDVSGGEVTMFSERSVRTAAMSESDFGLITGNIVATVTGPPTEGAPEEVRLGIVMWDGTEGAYYTGGAEAPGGPRTLFVGPTNSPDQGVWTAEGQEIFLNSMAATIPEPSTYALWAGFGVLGMLLLRRRFSRG